MEAQAADGDVTSNHDSKPASVPLPKLQAHLQCAERLEESRNRRTATSIHKHSEPQSLTFWSARTKIKTSPLSPMKINKTRGTEPVVMAG